MEAKKPKSTVRSKTGSSRETSRIFFRGFSTPRFPFCTIPETENSEMKPRSFSLKHFDQTPRFSNSEFSVLHYTQNGKLGDENLGVFRKAV